jgi:hypothetical protein
MDPALRQLVWDRANSRCEYCHLSEAHSFYPFQVDHILAEKHGGLTVADNLALSCYYCNTYKGPCIAGWDAMKADAVRLFNPRRDDWNDHFRWDGPFLLGRSEIGRATIHVLQINHPDAVEVRRLLVESGKMLT